MWEAKKDEKPKAEKPADKPAEGGRGAGRGGRGEEAKKEEEFIKNNTREVSSNKIKINKLIILLQNKNNIFHK